MQDLEYTEEQIMIRDMARDFARGEIAPYAQAWEKAGWIDDALVAKLGELGLLGMVVPEEWVALMSITSPTPWPWKKSPQVMPRPAP